MDELEQLRTDLSHKKSEAQLLCDSMWSQIQNLWDRLDTAQVARAEAKKHCPGIKRADIEQLKKVSSLVHVCRFVFINFLFLFRCLKGFLH